MVAATAEALGYIRPYRGLIQQNPDQFPGPHPVQRGLDHDKVHRAGGADQVQGLGLILHACLRFFPMSPWAEKERRAIAVEKDFHPAWMTARAACYRGCFLEAGR